MDWVDERGALFVIAMLLFFIYMELRQIAALLRSTRSESIYPPSSR